MRETPNNTVIDFDLEYFDIRRAPGGVQFTFGPGPVGPIISRLAWETFVRLYECVLQGKEWNGPSRLAPNGGLSGVLFLPPTSQDDGRLVSVNAVDGVDGAPPASVVFRGVADDEGWQHLGQYLRDWYGKVPRPLDTELTEGWVPEEYLPCTECSRPVFDSEPSVMASSRNLKLRGVLVLMCMPCYRAAEPSSAMATP